MSTDTTLRHPMRGHRTMSNTTAPETRRERAAFRPLPTPLDRVKAAARELRNLPGQYTRLRGAEGNGDRVADLVTSDAGRIGDAILEHAELIGIELAEVASHSHRYAADRDRAEAALRDIRHLVETAHERHTADTVGRIESILDEAGVQ
ncbi:hypothetical protein SEA_ZETA1847_58 [Microbacterium phage Zeta1847]|uniref:Uncharacterized protein n=1 Tax=Microbacterium phage Zeta1847 TaxID=2201444 RepID=A0A2Z4Q9E7_9CAUD|nr:hypothetical protein HOT46_gp58 [Microbacterium phage Zeta1847]AWY06692.1 hypothetical protein SEA_ZETA1847_58 [Microbacterium phage Zeta1847]